MPCPQARPEEDAIMHLISFFAATVEAALAKGRRELGPNALIVQSRKAPPESRHLGPWELVLAVQGSPPAQTEVRQPPALITAGEPLTQEVAELRRQIDGIGR